MYGFVRDVINEKGNQVFTIPMNASVADAVHTMNANGVGALVAMQAGGIAGIFTERDILRRVVDEVRGPNEIRVAEVMTSPVRTIAMSTTVNQAMEIMTRDRVRHLPILVDGDLAGILSIGDVMRWVMLRQQRDIDQMKDYITGRA